MSFRPDESGRNPLKSMVSPLEFVSCMSPGIAPNGPASKVRPAGNGPLVARGKTGMFVVDMHCHALSKRAEALVKAEHKGPFPHPLANVSAATKQVAKAQNERVEPDLTDLARRLAVMDRMAVDMQVISPAPPHYYTWTEAGLGREACRMVNDDIAAMAATNPKRFAAMGTVPLQDTPMAIAEMRRCVKDLGMRGIEINSDVEGEELACARLEPFFAAAEELGTLIFLHPTGFVHERFNDHYFSNVLGNPLNSTIAVAHLIFGGTFERHPRLKMCVAHGGGFLPAYHARIDHGHGAREDCCLNISRKPSEYLKQLYFDTMVFDPHQLGYLVQQYGADKILLGTDFPFDMGEDDPVGLVLGVPGLSEQQRAGICGLNAAKLLGIEVPRQ